jgi:hypothetical protein
MNKKQKTLTQEERAEEKKNNVLKEQGRKRLN